MVYFIRRASDRAIKIGSANHVGVRFVDLQREYRGDALTLLHSVAGNVRGEHDLHRHFHADALGREWFRPSLRLLSLVEAFRGTLTLAEWLRYNPAPPVAIVPCRRCGASGHNTRTCGGGSLPALDAYLRDNQLTQGEIARRLQARGLRVGPTWISQLRSGKRTAGPLLAIAIDEVTGGAVSKESLRPDLFSAQPAVERGAA